MSDPSTSQLDQPMQQSPVVVTSANQVANSGSVQNQIPHGTIQQSNNQTAESNQQQFAQPSYPSQLRPQGVSIPPSTNNSDVAPIPQPENNFLNPHPSSVPANPPPTIQPLLSLEPDVSGDHGVAKGFGPSVGSNIVPTTITGQTQDQKSQQQSSPQKTMVTKVKLSDELNIFDWLRTTDIINQIAEKAKSSVDSVITALDPGMKEYLYSGGNINIIVISDYDNFVSPIRDVFQTVFGRATVAPAKNNSPVAATGFPIKLAHGFNEAIKVAQERIKQLRLDSSHVPQNQVVVAVQPSIVHVIDSDNDNLHGMKLDESIFTSCYLTYCLLLEDPVLGLSLNSCSQFIPLDADTIATLNQSKLPEDSSYHKLGYTRSVDDLMNSQLKLLPEEGSECQWLHNWAGLEVTQIIHELSSTLAHMYRRKWTDCIS